MVSILGTIVKKQGDTVKSQSQYRNQIASLTDKITAGKLMRSGENLIKDSAGKIKYVFIRSIKQKEIAYYDLFLLVCIRHNARWFYRSKLFIIYSITIKIFRIITSICIRY